MDYALHDVLDIPLFQVLQDRLNVIYSFPSAIIDLDGNVLTATAWQDVCTKFHRVHPACAEECRKSDEYINSRLGEARPAVTYKCPHGLVDNATPIVVGGKHLGNFFTGQFFLDAPDLEFFRQQARKYGFEETAYLDAVAKVPIWSQERLTQYLDFIKGFVEIIASIGYKNLQEIEARVLLARNEEALNQARLFNEQVVASAHEGVIVYGPDLRYVLWNPYMERLSGKAAKDVVGRHPTDVFPFLKEAGVVARLERALTGEVVETIEFPFTTEIGTSGWTEDASAPLYGKDGSIIGVIATVRDITARKRAEAERERLGAQLSQALKMESVGRLAGGVAHDFNNMLSVILGHTELALAQVDDGSPLHADLLEVQKAAQRSADLTRQLLGFAREQTVTPRVLDLNDTVAGMLKMLRRLIGEDIDLVWRPGAHLSPVKIDPGQVDQVLVNLCVNARDAIDGVGMVTIETGEAAFDEAYCATHAGFAPGRYVRMAIGDNGRGMDEETQAHLFEPFFTTKAVGQGTGLGLATVYGIIKQNDGFIQVWSEPGYGTTFSIYLPQHGGQPEPVRTERAAEPADGGHETVLLVEDERAILTLAARILESLGYRVLAAGTPLEALRLAEEYRGEIHLLMTDVVMPEMNGRDLAQRLLSLSPRIRCLFTSGYTANVIAPHGVLDAGVHFLQKPFSLKTLAARVRAVLDEDAPRRD